MEFIKNIDDCFRISLLDLRFELNLKPNNSFKIDYNELTKQITLTPIENISELNLDTNKNTLELCSKPKDQSSTFWENGVLKHKIQSKPKSINEFFNLKPEDIVTKEKVEHKNVR